MNMQTLYYTTPAPFVKMPISECMDGLDICSSLKEEKSSYDDRSLWLYDAGKRSSRKNQKKATAL